MSVMQNGLAVPRFTGGADVCAKCGARRDSVCAAIDEADLARLAKAAVQISVAAGQTFVQEGDPAEHFFNITGGTARLFKLLPDGRRQITGFAGLGHFLGLAVRDAYTFGAEAIEPVTLCRFSRSSLRGLLDDFPAMERSLLQSASNELVAAQEQMLLLGRKTARERLASFLIALATAGRPCLPHNQHVALPMTRSDIADYVGLTIETVSRTFTKLKADGLIDLPGGHGGAIICDLQGLEAIAGGLD
jgi:CRP/FNR family transcriptional regulator